jgi:hypothetical protein
MISVLDQISQVVFIFSILIDEMIRMQEALDLWAAEMKFKNNLKIAPRVLAA